MWVCSCGLPGQEDIASISSIMFLRVCVGQALVMVDLLGIWNLFVKGRLKGKVYRRA